ncbi:MAG: hypothetical protein QM742_11995 [Aquabacterium sp.]
MSQSSSIAEEAYRVLLDAYWQQSPGTLRDVSNLEALHAYLADVETLDNAAVALGFLAQDELLLAGNLLARGDRQAWEWLDRAQAHAYLGYKYLGEAAWLPSRYTGPIFGFGTFCAFFSLALARGSEAKCKWYAQQLYNLKRGGLADWSCEAVEYVDFYFELAVAVMNDEWPEVSYLSEDMGPYKDLFMHPENLTRQMKALLTCADHHLDLSAISAPRNDAEAAHPFRSAVGHVAFELWGWLAMRKRLDAATMDAGAVPHLMLLPEFFKPSPPQQTVTDDITLQFDENARARFGGAWQKADTARNFDELWPQDE